ncbi:MAG: hypothetical protein JEZ05_00065 [Tenericutes bacterium]|nr:hypothetical protein [Mycoplasmatota bacterium]
MGKEIRKNVYTLIVIILFILSIGFATATFHLLGVLEKNNETYVGTIAVSNYEENQYANIISSALLDWEENANYQISYQNIDLSISLDYFEVDINSTVAQIQEDKINNVLFNTSDANKILFTDALSDKYSTNIINQIDMDALLDDIISNLETMSVLNIYYLEDYFNEGAENTVLSSFTLTNLSSVDVDAITDNITSFEIEELSRFDLLEQTTDFILTNNQLSILASGIQLVSKDSNLNAFIFEQNAELPSWGLEGGNVRILQTNHYNFSLFNTFNYSMTLTLSKNDANSITFELIGYPFACDYATAKVTVTDVDFNTTYIENDTLNAATPGIIATENDEDYIYQLLIQAGVNGRILKFERTTTYPDGTTEKIVLYYEEYHATSEIYQENIIAKDGD